MNYRTRFTRSSTGAFIPMFASSLAFAFLLLATAFAQQAPSSQQDSEIVMMNPFEVSAERDYGYQPISTLAGGRIETDLKDTPAAISILTKEFMEDLAIDNVQDLAMWSVSSEGSDPGSSFSDDFQISTRGLGNNTFGSRNYFRFYGNSDSYNVERLEFARGPNALLFGEAAIGGVTTTWTKQAKLGRKFGELQLKLDAWGGVRTTADFNYSANNRFAIRLNALYADAPSWRDRAGQWNKDIHIASTVGITKTVQFRAEYQHSEKERWGAAFNPYIDQMTTWINNNGDVNSPVTEGSAGWAVLSGADLVWNAARPQDGILNWNGFYRSSGSGLVLGTDPRPGLLNSPVVPSREFNTSSIPGSSGLFKIDTASFYLDKRFGKLFAQIAYNYSRPYKTLAENRWNTTYLDLNKLLPNGEENPYYLQPYGEAMLAGRQQENILHEFRAMFAWAFKNSWTSQSFSMLASRRIDQYKYSPTRYIPLGAKSYIGNEAVPYKATSTTDAMRIRRYWSSLDADTIPTHMTNPETGEVLPMGYRAYSADKNETLSDGIQISNVGKYFRERLIVVAGYRYDHYQKDTWSIATRNADDSPATFSKDNERIDIKAHSPSIGAVYWIGNVGFSVNYAKNFTPVSSGNPDINGKSLDPSTGEGYDYSIRFAFSRDLTGSINYYQSTVNGGVGTPANDNLYAQYINAIWKAMGDTTRASIMSEYRDKSDSKGRGWEFELVYNPTKNWRMRLSGNIPEGFSSNQIKFTRGYIEANRAEWNAFIADETQDPQSRHDAAENLINLDERVALDTRPGLKRAGMLDWKGNYFTSYRFSRGALKGLSIGGGATYEGRRLIDSVRNSDGTFIYRYSSGGRFIATAFAKYEFKVYKTRTSIQLNVGNIFDNDDLDYRVITTYNGQRYYGRYNYITPRSFSLTTKVNF